MPDVKNTEERDFRFGLKANRLIAWNSSRLTGLL